MLEDNAFFQVRTQGVGVISRELAQERRRLRAAHPRLRRDLRPAARRAVLLVRGLRLQGAGGDGGRLLRALPRPHGRVPRVDPDRAPGARRAARGADLLAAGREVGGAGARRQGRGVRAGRRRARRGRLLPRRRRRRQAVPPEVARRLVLQPLGAPAHHPRLHRSPTSSRSWARSIPSSARSIASACRRSPITRSSASSC